MLRKPSPLLAHIPKKGVLGPGEPFLSHSSAALPHPKRWSYHLPPSLSLVLRHLWGRSRKVRIDSSCARSRVMSNCIEWKGSKNRKGYGQVQILGKQLIVHRVSFRLWKGPIPRGFFVCHTCDNPPCYSPEHLFLGSNRENQRDSVRKGRHWSTRKNFCPAGHPLSGTNLYARKDGTRECKECRRENVRRWRRTSGV